MPNPAGRPPAGASLKEWLNVYAAAGMTEDELRTIARDKTAPWAKRAAANRALRTVEAPDLADFGDFMAGTADLEALRTKGIDTAIIKRVKERRTTLRMREGSTEETVTREVELFDRAGEEFDRICDRTDGKPKQSMDVTSHGEVRFTLNIGRPGGDEPASN